MSDEALYARARVIDVGTEVSESGYVKVTAILLVGGARVRVDAFASHPPVVGEIIDIPSPSLDSCAHTHQMATPTFEEPNRRQCEDCGAVLK